MRNILAIITLSLLAGCMYSPPPGTFDVRSSSNEQIIGHCVTDPTSVEATAFRERTKELVNATTRTSPIPGLRSITIEEPEYQYILYAPTATPAEPYHVACPTSGNRSNCILAGSYAGGNFEAHISLETASRVQAAVRAALAVCRQNDG